MTYPQIPGFVITPYAIMCLATACLAAIVAAIAWPRRSVAGGASLVWLMIAIAEWSLGVAIEYAAVGIPAKVFWSKVEYIGTLSSPVFFLLLRSNATAWNAGSRSAISPCCSFFL
jgi:hypothetical protein